MPITAELENVRKLESVGFTHGQAVVIAQVQEDTAQDSVQDLKDFIRAENKEFSSEIRAENKEFRSEIRAEIKGLRAEAQAGIKDLRSEISTLELRMNASFSDVRGEIKASQADLLVKLFGIIFGCSSLVVAVLKLIL